MPTRLPGLVILTLLVIIKSQLLSNAQSIAEWSADIEYLSQQVEKQVPSLYNKANTTLWENGLQRIKHELSTSTEEQNILAIQELLVSIGDEGCRISPFQEQLDYPTLPIKTYWFTDGMFICAAADEYKHLVQQEITAINGIPIDTLFARMQAVIPGDNIYAKYYHFPLYMQIPAWLRYAGVPDVGETVKLTLGNEEVVTVNFTSVEVYSKLNRQLANAQQFNKMSYEDANYWYTYIPDQQALLVQLLQIRDGEIGFKAFTKELLAQLTKYSVNKLIIDNRYGGGGNGFKLKPFVEMIKTNSQINKVGHLFILTSRATRGTLVELTSMLELNTNAILVGEPTSEGPNSVADTKSITLPNTGITVNLSHKFWPTSWPQDPRTTLLPQITIDYTSDHYIQEQDPWLQAVFNFNPPQKQLSPTANSAATALVGKHRLNGRTFDITIEDNELWLYLNRRTASFFEWHTRLYQRAEGVLATNTPGIHLHYSVDAAGQYIIEAIDWEEYLAQ